MKTKLASGLFLGFLLTASSSGTAAAQTKTVSFIHTGAGLVVIVDIAVGGSTRHFLLDTGSSVTVLSPDTAVWSPVEAVNSLSRRSIVGIDGSTHSAASTTAALDFGRTIVVTRATVAELTGLSKALHIKLDGILGQDVLLQFSRVTIDYKNKQLILEK
jgi:predicted aspartyl protease